MAIKFLNTLQVDANVLYVDATTNNVGIGTASPTTGYSKVLQIHASGNGSTLRLTDSGSGSSIGNGLELLQSGMNSYIINRESGPMYFYTSGTTQMTISSTGDVGIGITSPGYKLDVNGTGRFTDVLYASKYIRIEEAGTTANIANGLGYSQGTEDFGYTGNDGIVRYLNHYGIGIHRPIGASVTGGRGFYMGGFFGIDFFTSGNNRLHIAQAGNVGIGTTSPSHELTVQGGLKVG